MHILNDVQNTWPYYGHSRRAVQTQGPHSHILMTGGGGGVGGPTEVHILYSKKSQLQNLSTQKNPYFFSIPKKIPQCFCISKFYYLSSGKLKHANFNFGFGQKQNYKLRLCYFLFELMKNTIPKKIPVLFSRPKKIPFGQNVRPKKILRTPPVIKICEWGPWGFKFVFIPSNFMANVINILDMY